MKKISLIALFPLLMSALMCFSVYAEIEVDDESYYAKFRDKDISLNVYNWGEYISDGSDDSIDVIEEFEKISGRKYGLFEEYKTEDADYIMLIMGSAAGTAKQAVHNLRKQGKKVGIIKLRVFRPFPAKELAEALKNCKAVAIMDRCESYNGNGGPLGSEVTAGLFRNKVMISAVNYIYGLAGRDFTVEDVYDIFAELEEAETNGTEVEQYQYVGLRK